MKHSGRAERKRKWKGRRGRGWGLRRWERKGKSRRGRGCRGGWRWRSGTAEEREGLLNLKKEKNEEKEKGEWGMGMREIFNLI